MLDTLCLLVSRQATRERLASLRRALKERLVKRVLLVNEEREVRPETLVLRAKQVSLGHRETRARQGPQEQTDCVASRVTRENLESGHKDRLERPAQQEQKATKATVDSKANSDQWVGLAHLVPKASQDHKDLKDIQDSTEKQDRSVHQASLAKQVPQEAKETRAMLA